MGCKQNYNNFNKECVLEIRIEQTYDYGYTYYPDLECNSPS